MDVIRSQLSTDCERMKPWTGLAAKTLENANERQVVLVDNVWTPKRCTSINEKTVVKEANLEQLKSLVAARKEYLEMTCNRKIKFRWYRKVTKQGEQLLKLLKAGEKPAGEVAAVADFGDGPPSEMTNYDKKTPSISSLAKASPKSNVLTSYVQSLRNARHNKRQNKNNLRDAHYPRSLYLMDNNEPDVEGPASDMEQEANSKCELATENSLGENSSLSRDDNFISLLDLKYNRKPNLKKGPTQGTDNLMNSETISQQSLSLIDISPDTLKQTSTEKNRSSPTDACESDEAAAEPCNSSNLQVSTDRMMSRDESETPRNDPAPSLDENENHSPRKRATGKMAKFKRPPLRSTRNSMMKTEFSIPDQPYQVSEALSVDLINAAIKFIHSG